LGSIRRRRATSDLSYKAAWDAVQALNNLFDAPLVDARAGGAGGGAPNSPLRDALVVSAFRRVEADLAEVFARIEKGLAGAPMRTSAEHSGVSACRPARGTPCGASSPTSPTVRVKRRSRLRVATGVDITAVVTREASRPCVWRSVSR
jgi:molybdate transport system regulatory protein